MAAPTITILPRLADIAPEAWDACAAPGGRRRPGDPGSVVYDPFTTHAFLAACEESGSAVPRTGWQGQHLVLEQDGITQGVMPLWLKGHSRGEYVFDHAFADAFERAGGSYYPKLLGAVPFTPATGRRLLLAPGADVAGSTDAMAAGLAEVMRMTRASSVHINFLPEPEAEALATRGFLRRTDQQFHFTNPGYRDFDDFLDQLASRKRKAIRKERRDALCNGISIEWLTGSDITEAALDAFFAFYIDTGGRKWGRPYLTRPFFSLIAERMREDILLVMAKRGGRFIAGAINFLGSETVFGRHWGAIEEHPFLHFEVCYYQAIDFAMAHKFPRVEAGAQGEHKISRGYLPTTTHSVHRMADAGFHRAVADYLRREREQVAAMGVALAEGSPFRRLDGAGAAGYISADPDAEP